MNRKLLFVLMVMCSTSANAQQGFDASADSEPPTRRQTINPNSEREGNPERNATLQKSQPIERPPKPIERSKKQGPVSLRVRVDRSEARIAEPIQMEIRLAADAGTAVIEPEFDNLLQPWTVVNKESFLDVPDADSDRREWSWLVTLETYRTDRQSIPEIAIEYRLPGLVTSQRIRVEPIEVRIVSVLAQGDDPAQPRGLKGPIENPSADGTGSLSRWWIVAGVCAPIIALIAGLYFRRPRTDPVQVARQRIFESQQAFERSTLTLTESYQHLSSTLRDLIQTQWSIPAHTASSEELILALEHRVRSDDAANATTNAPNATITALNQFMEAADRAKFAGVTVDEAGANEVFASASRLVTDLGELARAYATDDTGGIT